MLISQIYLVKGTFCYLPVVFHSDGSYKSPSKRQTSFQVISNCSSFSNTNHCWCSRQAASVADVFERVENKQSVPSVAALPTPKVLMFHLVILSSVCSICLVILFIFCCFLSLSQSLMVPLCVHHLATQGKYGSVKCISSCVALCAPVVCVWFRGIKNPTKPFAMLCPSSQLADPNIAHSIIQLNECRVWHEWTDEHRFRGEWKRGVIRKWHQRMTDMLVVWQW